MGKFTEFVNQKLLKEEAKKVSTNLLKNIIDVMKEYVTTEYDLSEDEKMQIINNMEISVEEHGKGILTNSPKFVATSKYNESEGKSTPVEITIEIVTEKIGRKSEVEPADDDDDASGGEEIDNGSEE